MGDLIIVKDDTKRMINSQFRKSIIAMRGEKGRRWLKELPEIIKHYEKKWGLTVFPPFTLSYNYVAPAKTLNGKNVVLKITFPENEEFEKEIRALKFFNGDAAVQVLEEDLKKGVVLLEKAKPGELLRGIISNSKRISIVSGLIKRLHKPIAKKEAYYFPTTSDWAKVFDRYRNKYSINSGPVPKWMIDKGEGIFKELKFTGNPVLLHGDLHPDNILSSERGWLVIDPKGVVGESEFELASFLRNPVYDYPKGSDYKKITQESISRFSDILGFDKKRIFNWTFVYAIFSILWFLEDQGELKEIYLQNAEILNEINLH